MTMQLNECLPTDPKMVPEIRKALAPHASKFIETLVSLTKQPLRLQVTRGAVQTGTFMRGRSRLGFDNVRAHVMVC
ncbi:MAG TPA: hypothetical protein VF953_11190 [Terriglobales bacterium]